MAFILGAPRSGTSWLSKLLGTHPSLVAPPETHLFSRYLAPMHQTWSHHRSAFDEVRREIAAGVAPRDRVFGLATVLTSQDFDRLTKDFVDGTMDRVIASKPGARIVVEKTPAHSNHVDLIDRLTDGNALFIHLIRDGREVAESLVRVSSTWGRRWAPNDPDAAAAMWRRFVLGALEARELDDRYIEVRYEALVRSPQDELDRIFDFLGVSPLHIDPKADGTVVPVAPTAFTTGTPEPQGFRGEASRWSPDIAFEIERIAGPLMASLGYELDPTLSSRPHRTIQSAKSVGRRLRRRLRRTIRQ
ncbi:sulfotransferase family protein [Actinospongicola halichondriae]|uniref:sulfotransferase family protein n=1 Tax=Actinospongicola halichondriae TaxID=3236844 RepID=UPI003D4A40BE